MTDPRPLFAQAHAWFAGLIADLDATALAAPTPCPDWQVRTVVAHVIGAARRPRVVAQGGLPSDVPLVVDGIPDAELAATHLDAVRETLAVWSDPAVLDRPVTAPWGTVPGRAALAVWVKEPLVHGWDVAVALGLPSEAPAAVAEAAVADMARFLPADRRGEGVPFAAPVPVAAGAGPTERLAAWLGHARP
jgi:uncharacterized protein (TIGR03086 family)